MEQLLGLLNDKVVALDEEISSHENRIREVEKIQRIIRKIKENPYLLFTDDGEKYIDFLELDKKKIALCRKIYEGYLVLGREGIPQISMVEEESDKISESLQGKVCFLSDLIAANQARVVVRDGLLSLRDEVRDSEKYITEQKMLILLLETSNISIEEKNKIKLQVIDRNNRIHRDLKNSLISRDADTLEEENEFQRARQTLMNELENNFGEDALKNLKSLSELLSNECDSKKLEDMIHSWQYSISDDYVGVIDGLISLKTIELLDYKETFGEESEEVLVEITELKNQIDVLNRCKQVILMEKDELEVETVEGNIYQQALAGYSSDLSTYPNRVLFLGKSVCHDISSIDDNETLKDIFILIEMLKNNEHERNSKNFTGLDVQQLSPNKTGRQARVRYVRLEENTYVIVHVDGKKADKTKRETQTIAARLKEVPRLRNVVRNNGSSLVELAEMTTEASDKLYETVSAIVKSKGGE